MKAINSKHHHGKPCRVCQATLRYKRNNNCVACELKRSIKRREYTKQWTKQNQPKVKQYKQQWAKQNVAELREYHKGWRGQRSPEQIKKVSAKAKENYQKNPEPQRLNAKRSKHKRKALMQSMCIPYTNQQLMERFARFGNQCVYCGDRYSELTSDHFFPISKGGVDAIKNIVPACRPCNSQKHNLDPLIWMKRKGLGDRYINELLHLIWKLID